VNSLDRDWK